MRKAVITFMVLLTMVFFAYAQDQASTSTTMAAAGESSTSTTMAAGETSTSATTGAEMTSTTAGTAESTTSTAAGAASGTDQSASKVPTVSVERQKASEILGYSIVNAKGDKIGSIKDLIITSDGKVPYATASFNDLKTNGDVIVPVKAFTLGSDQNGKRATLSMDVQQLQNAPVVEKNTLGAGWEQNAGTFYQGKVQGMDTAQTGAGQAYLASQLLGYSVKGTGDDTIGSVNDIMIDLGKDQVAYVAMGYGGFLGIGEKLFAIPMDAFQVNGQDKYLTLSADKKMFDGAKGFDRDNWPTEAAASWQQDIQSQTLGSGESTTTTQASGETTESTAGASGAMSGSDTSASDSTTSTSGAAADSTGATTGQ